MKFYEGGRAFYKLISYEEISMLVPVKVGIMYKLDLEKAISIYFFNYF